jgi:hypothetical protein
MVSLFSKPDAAVESPEKPVLANRRPTDHFVHDGFPNPTTRRVFYPSSHLIAEVTTGKSAQMHYNSVAER